jgi:hypothetical protein
VPWNGGYPARTPDVQMCQVRLARCEPACPHPPLKTTPPCAHGLALKIRSGAAHGQRQAKVPRRTQWHDAPRWRLPLKFWLQCPWKGLYASIYTVYRRKQAKLIFATARPAASAVSPRRNRCCTHRRPFHERLRSCYHILQLPIEHPFGPRCLTFWPFEGHSHLTPLHSVYRSE